MDSSQSAAKAADITLSENAGSESPEVSNTGAMAPDAFFSEEDRSAGREVAVPSGIPRNLPQKTFVSLITELSVERGRPLKFELLSSEGRVHEPTFVYRAVFGENSDYIGNGAGKSKRLAKHMAAKRCLEKMFADESENFKVPGAESMSRAEAMVYLAGLMPELGGAVGTIADASAAAAGDSSLPIVPTVGPLGPNPIGKLQELISQNRWPTVAYDDLEPEGDPHERIYKTEVRVGRFTERGEGKNKKAAKREAAEKMLMYLQANRESFIKSISEAEMEPDDGEADGDAPAEGETGGDSGDVSATAPVAVAPAHQPLPDLKDRFDIIRKRNFSTETPSVEHLRLLNQLVAQEKYTEPVFSHLGHRGQVTEHFMCLMEIAGLKSGERSTLLPITVHGIGDTREMAEYSCALHALEVIAICTEE